MKKYVKKLDHLNKTKFWHETHHSHLVKIKNKTTFEISYTGENKFIVTIFYDNLGHNNLSQRIQEHTTLNKFHFIINDRHSIKTIILNDEFIMFTAYFSFSKGGPNVIGDEIGLTNTKTRFHIKRFDFRDES
ncbi:hypothetical protein RF11_02501 [Thelohanellus kitauei]|uniref:Uncharacterized protein n=1 Tax=Thelohanellus kitauei TaxID=669202 RepID=A0A0C2ML79_THEKT|nr:hypothetical protein RF11_02501 [Thelohanellus kitauei]